MGSLQHIVIISKTWLDDSVVLSGDTFANCNIFGTDCKKNGGDVLMLVNKLLHASQIENFAEGIEVILCEIHLNKIKFVAECL